ncbi:ParA family protein [Streptomyces lusitanus]|uniref:ParA family protein n=1 Tax=Streptomyces lusitanus TaxID=68232 RepID=UPI003629DDCE
MGITMGNDGRRRQVHDGAGAQRLRLWEMGYRVCVVDFDAQCHLTQQLGLEMIGIDEPSIAKHMLGEAKGELVDLLVPIEAEAFGGRLFVPRLQGRLLARCQARDHPSRPGEGDGA